MQFGKKSAPKCGKHCPISGQRKVLKILSRLWQSRFFFRSRLKAIYVLQGYFSRPSKNTLQNKHQTDISKVILPRRVIFSGLQTYPNLHPPPRVGPPLGCLPRGGANLCRFVPVRSLQRRASGREFVHVCFGLLGPLVQVGANSDGFPKDPVILKILRSY